MQMNKHLDQELADYALEQLKGKKRAVVESHLGSCPACSAQLAEVQQLVIRQGQRQRRVSLGDWPLNSLCLQ
jgi:anti-sigma factor RsiW